MGMVGKVLLLLLLLFYPSFSLEGLFSDGPKCPKEATIPVPETDQGCTFFCEKLSQVVGSGENYQARGDKNFGINATDRSEIAANLYKTYLCACRFYKPVEGNDLYAWDITCVYVVDVEEEGGLPQLKKIPLPPDTPTKLARLFLFSENNFKMNPHDSLAPLKTILGGFYAIYVKVLESFTFLFALYLVVLISFWNFLLPAGTAFARKLREGHVDFMSFISGELVSKSMVIIPAVAFFALPVSVGGDTSNLPNYSLPKLLNPKPNADTGNNTGSGTGGEGENILAFKPCDGIRESIQTVNAIESLERQLSELDSRTDISNEEKSRKRKELEERLEELKKLRNCDSIWAGGGQNQSGIKWEVYDPDNPSLSEIKIPVVLAVVREFVEFGLDSAKAASEKINLVILAYQNARLKNERRAAEAQNQSLQYYIDHEESLAQAINRLAGEYEKCIIKKQDSTNSQQPNQQQNQQQQNQQQQSVCSFLNSKENWNDKDPECPLGAYEALAELCRWHAMVQNERSQPQDDAGLSWYYGTSELGLASSVSKGFTWISPAVLPMVAMYDHLTGIRGKIGKASLSGELLAGPQGDSYKEDVVEYNSRGAISINVFNPLRVFSLKFNSSTAFLFGQAIGITSIPPFSSLKSALSSSISNTTRKGGKFLRKAAKIVPALPIPAAPLIGAGMEMAGKFLQGAAGFAGSMLGLYLSYIISVNLLKVLPFFVVSAVVMFRFLGYLFDLAKFIISLPFFAVGAATKNPASALAFFTHTIRLTAMPILLAFMPLVAFVGIELTFFLLYELPVKYILGAGERGGMVYGFITGVATGIHYVVVSFLSVKVAWELSNGFIEGVFSYVSQLAGHFQSAGAAIARGASGSAVPGR